MQDMWKTTGSDQSLLKGLELEPSGETSWRDLEDNGLNGGLRHDKKKELEVILERDVLSATLPEFLTVRRMRLEMSTPMLVLSV